jgi:hypothetical protein
MVTTLKETFGRQYTSKITGQNSATKVYCVITNTDYDELTELVIDAIAAGLPALGDAFGVDSGETSLIATEHIPKEIEKELRYYNIEVRYESNQGFFATPTERIWQINFSSVLEEYSPYVTRLDTRPTYPAPNRILGVDASEPVLNTAGIAFDPYPTDYRVLTEITLTKNFSSITNIGSVTDIDDLMGFTNYINADAVTIAGIAGDQYSFWMQSIQAQNVIDNGFNYYSVTFKVVHDPDLHIKKILNAGWEQRHPTDAGKTIPMFTNLGANISSPWLLDENGFQIEGATIAARTAKCRFLGLGLKYARDFADLSLPTQFNFS